MMPTIYTDADLSLLLLMLMPIATLITAIIINAMERRRYNKALTARRLAAKQLEQSQRIRLWERDRHSF